MPFPTLNDHFNPRFNFGTDSLFVQKSEEYTPTPPPVVENFLLLDGTHFLLLEGGDFDLLT